MDYITRRGNINYIKYSFSKIFSRKMWEETPGIY